MRILIDNSSYHLQNMGDMAMLQVAVQRLRRLWPNAEMTVITESPDRLAAMGSELRPLSFAGRRLWLQRHNLFGGLHRLVFGKCEPWLDSVEACLRRSYPKLSAEWIERRLRKRGVDCAPLTVFLRRLSEADLVLATGGGYITDEFEQHALEVLETIWLAKSLGKRVAMLGQGLGPIRSPRLQAIVRRVLPMLDLLTLREGVMGPVTAKSCGVSPNRVLVSGDDAIELAYVNRPEAGVGRGIGFNLRLAHYSTVGGTEAGAIGDLVQGFARRAGVPVIGIPISRHAVEDDAEVLIRQVHLTGDAAQQLRGIDCPLDAIRQAGKCRVVVTGSYHAAVFALSQGVPAIGLAKSDYYVDKFVGLAKQFGEGCQVIRLQGDGVNGRAEAAIATAWEKADHWREALLRAAEHQVRTAREAYCRAYLPLLERGAA